MGFVVYDCYEIYLAVVNNHDRNLLFLVIR